MRADKVEDGVLIEATQPPAGEEYVWPEDVVKIGAGAFSHWCGYDAPLRIPEGVTHIGHMAFYDWNSFDNVLTFPESLVGVGTHAFYRWYKFNQPFKLPEGLKTIENFAFDTWHSFDHPFSIPASVKTIGRWAFDEWLSLKQPNSVRTRSLNGNWHRIDNWCFCSCWSGTVEQLKKRLEGDEGTLNRWETFERVTEGYEFKNEDKDKEDENKND